MSLTIEWGRRIDNWRNELPRHFYRELGEIAFSGFITTEQLTVQEAAQQQFAPMPPGTPWGAKWEYAWFKGELTLPESAAGQRIVLCVDLGGESAVYVNGVAVGARDAQHQEITLAMQGVPGQRYDIMVEAYAGHGPRVHYAGPTPPGRETVPEPGPTQAVVGRSTFGIWEEDAYQLWIDVETLYGIRNNIDPNSLRVAEIDQGLRDFATIVDFELPLEERLATMRACRERLRPLLECQNGSTAPTLFAFGHSHIDVAWLWPLAETERKCVRTFSTQIALMQEYPEYRFLQSQPHLLRMVKMQYPDLYARIKEAVRSGQFMVEGGMWVEADTNISSGESLIRQFMHGKRFLRDEFGVECEMLWLPDVFGYSGALPQIMRGCGIRYFSTAKIFWAYNGGDPFPYNTFTWEGIDGSTVLVHLCNDYNSRTDAASIIERWNQRVQKDGFSTRLVPFGWGDGGGGPTRDHLEYLRRMGNLEGVPMVRIAAPTDYFHDQEARGIPDARYVGELYFQAHRGTYTSQAKTKLGNRKSELALREAELWGAAAQVLKGYAYPLPLMDESWKAVLLNQFHDIIPGSSIHRVYEEAEAAYAEVIDTADEISGEAASLFTDDSNAVTVFNSLSWDRKALVELPEYFAGAVDVDGQPIPVQFIDSLPYAEVQVPACGWTTVQPADLCESANLLQGTVQATERSLENDLLRVEFNDRGEITSIFDKEINREISAGVCNSFKMYKDVPTNWDAWDLDSLYPLTPVELDEPATIEVIAEGPIVAVLQVTRKLHDSDMVQEISLRAGSRRVDFDTQIEWRESHKMLKVAFPVDIHANEAVHEVQFGHIRRPNHYSRPFDADRFEVSAHKWSALMEENRGFAVLNDCKYGVNVLGNTINLTLLKSAMAPDMTADKGLQEFSYALYAWNGCFADSDVIREAYDLNVPIMVVSGAAGQQSLFNVDAPNVIIETIKPAEDGSRDVIVRLYESKRMATRCTLTTALPVQRVAQTDMLENEQAELPVENGAVSLDLRPFQVCTLRLQLAD
ncbi:MAG: alpha-mannosidase [Chloroflexi bacterium]|jgi:alpha-mannosidase|nr:alpha-mannosidase [Chloroflexota bacterium]